MAIDTNTYQRELEKEKVLLEEELRNVGRKNPENPSDWEATPADLNVLRADKNEVADVIEEFEGRAAIEVELENRLKNILDALARIKEGTYGICAVGGEPIEEKRLAANPAARTCIAHRNKNEA